MIRLLFFGDIFGKAGRLALLDSLPQLKQEFAPDFIIVNGENLADGRGLTEKTAKPLFQAGVDVITGGNHLWDRAESWDYLRRNPAIVKPINYPPATPGNICCTLAKNGATVSVLAFCGQIYMPPADSPWLAWERWKQEHIESAGSVIIDFHAESTAEKRAFGWFVDGEATALLGTHTHIQTADEDILPGGTAYITDVGMTGAHDSVIGVRKEIILDKFINGLPNRYQSSDRGIQLNGAYLEIDSSTGCAVSIRRIRRQVEYNHSDENHYSGE